MTLRIPSKNTPRSVEAAFRYFHVSNLLTYFSVFCGLMALQQAHAGRWFACGGWIALSVMADLLDGRFASLFTRRDSLIRFGVQIDSLCDALVFGLIPFATAWELVQPAASGLTTLFLFAAGFFFVSAGLTRLAAFNLAHDAGGFLGVPTTLSGLAWAVLLLFKPGPVLTIGYFLVFGILMIIPLRIRRPGIAAYAGLIALVSFISAVHFLLYRFYE